MKCNVTVGKALGFPSFVQGIVPDSSAVDGYKNVLNGGEKMHVKIDQTSYSITFGFKPNTFNGELYIIAIPR